MSFSADFDDFYVKCLEELRGRDNYSEAFLPLLERYVTLTTTLSKLNSEIVDSSLTAEHTNKANNKNEVSSPKWRMFLLLNKEACALAKELKLSPATAPIRVKIEKKGFDLGKMVVAK